MTSIVDGLQRPVSTVSVSLGIISLLYLRSWRRNTLSQRALFTFLPGDYDMVEASEEVYSSLRRRFKGDLLRPGNSGYEEARTIWNGMVARAPGLMRTAARR